MAEPGTSGALLSFQPPSEASESLVLCFFLQFCSWHLLQSLTWDRQEDSLVHNTPTLLLLYHASDCSQAPWLGSQVACALGWEEAALGFKGTFLGLSIWDF